MTDDLQKRIEHAISCFADPSAMGVRRLLEDCQAEIARLQRQLEAAEKVLREYAKIDDPRRLDRDWVRRNATRYFKSKDTQ